MNGPKENANGGGNGAAGMEVEVAAVEASKPKPVSASRRSLPVTAATKVEKKQGHSTVLSRDFNAVT